MSLVTCWGREIIERCDASTSTVLARMRFAMNSCSAGGSTRSAVPTRYQLGSVFQAGGPDGSDAALAASGRCVAASTAAFFAGRSLAKAFGNTPGST
jgi:hypothetical protein